jgi:ATP-dependent RNA helicase SUPV3L1/SUV3
VRIDILERLADIIRPLLQWKPGQASRPDGAYDGRRFTTTTAMLSILGATLDDMEEILKGLGYRADAVKPEEAATYLASHEVLSTPVVSAEEPVVSTEETGAPAEEIAGKAEHDDAEHATAEPTPEATNVEPEAAHATVDAPVAAAEASVSAEAPIDGVIELPGVEVVLTEPVEPKPVLLWRLGGRNDNQRQPRSQGDRRPLQGSGQAQNNNRREGAEQTAAPAADGNREARDARGKRGKEGGGGRPPQQGNRGDRNNDRQDRGDRKDRNDRNNNRGNAATQPLRFEAKPPRKEKPIDPDSPFAKLAVLREQMKK